MSFKFTIVDSCIYAKSEMVLKIWRNNVTVFWTLGERPTPRYCNQEAAPELRADKAHESWLSQHGEPPL
jgi:hypothetical protein